MESRSLIPGLDLAVVMRAFDGGGAQRDMVLLCNALFATGARITVLALHVEGPGRSLLDPAIDVIAVPGRKLRYAIPGLRRALRAVAPALVMSSEASLNLCSLLAVRTLPSRHRPKLVLREVGSPSIAQARDPYFQNRVAYRILRRGYRYADRIVALTEGARRDLITNFAVPAARISVMATNAVVPPDAAAMLARWDGETGRERNLIVCIGRLSPEKDQATLIRAAALLPGNRDWRLALVGDGPQRVTLEALARRHGLAGRITFTGQVADPFAWMRRAQVAVCSSVYEGLGNAIIEALACGTPVVSTDCPYGPVEILQAGRFGALTPVGDAAAMAAAIETAFDASPDRRALMVRGLHYTAGRAAERFLEIAAAMLPQRAPAAAPLAAVGAV